MLRLSDDEIRMAMDRARIPLAPIFGDMHLDQGILALATDLLEIRAAIREVLDALREAWWCEPSTAQRLLYGGVGGWIVKAGDGPRITEALAALDALAGEEATDAPTD